MGAKNTKVSPNKRYTITERNNNQGFVYDEDDHVSSAINPEKIRQSEINVLRQLKEEGIPLTNHRSGGVAFYVPVNEKTRTRLRKPTRLLGRFQSHGSLSSYDSDEKHIIADIIHKSNLRQKGENARIQSERLLKAAQRRDFMEMERRSKHEKRMQKIAEVRIMREEKLKQIKRIAQNSIHPQTDIHPS